MSHAKYFPYQATLRRSNAAYNSNRFQIREIISQLHRERQNLFFSATWPREVQQLANEFLNDAVQINIGDSGVLNANKVQHI